MNHRSWIFSLLAVALCACRTESPPAAPAAKPAESAPPATKPLFQKPVVGDWCVEHGVPESVCTRCNHELVAGFQAKKDWCAKHDLPDSQCLECHPELAAKWKALAPKK